MSAEQKALRTEVAALRDKDAIITLQTAYGYHIDKAQWDEPAGLFARQDTPELAPDAPKTVDYNSFPSVFIPPYHYPNPVTGKSWTKEHSA